MRRLPFICALLLNAVALRLDVRSNAPRSPGLYLSNFADRRYTASLQLGERNFTVRVDTGSSDLWVAGNVTQSNDTGAHTTLKYAGKSVQGPVKTANLKFGDHRVANQAFVQKQPDDDHSDGDGLLGLGFDTGSFIVPHLDGTEGQPMLYRLFSQQLSTPNYFTILLDRLQDPTDNHTGMITIGEVIPEFAAVLNQPRCPTVSLSLPAGEGVPDPHHQIQLDADGIIGPDGMPIPFQTEVKGVPDADKGRATAVLDSGFSLNQVPKFIADAIYSRIRGAEYVVIENEGSFYLVPCDRPVNVTLKIAGVEYPIHPLDITLDPQSLGIGAINNSRHERSCLGSFQPFRFERGESPSYDIILGMAFMRNVYTLFDYGDFIQNSVHEMDDPYIQLLPLTDPNEALLDFKAVRLNDADKESGAGDGESETGGKKSHPALIGAVTTVGVLLLLVAIFFVWRARKRRTSRRDRR